MVDGLTSIVVPTVFNKIAVQRLKALLSANTDQPYELIVVDTTPEARGYVWTSNEGLAQAQGDVLVVLNDDAQPQPGWLSPLCRAIIEEGIWLCSPGWQFARLGGHCLAFPRELYDTLGGFDTRYRHWCSDHHMELTLIDMGKPIRQVPESNVVHDPADLLRIHYRKSAKYGDWERLPNTGQWYLEDQVVFESIWGERRHHDYWPSDWSQAA